MKKIKSNIAFLSLIFILFLPFGSSAQPPQWVLDKYEPHNYLYTYKSEAKELAYRLMRPINFEESKKYPVIITLHGGTAFRTPNQTARYNIYSLQEYNEQLADDAIRTEYPTYVIAPQGKSDQFWIREDLAGLQEIIATLPSVDLNRIYILGSSAGGNGVHDFISTDPEYFAAAISAASNPDVINPDKRANLINFNLWHMVGEGDVDRNRYSGSVAFFNDMKSRNAKMKFTTFWKIGHSIGGSIIGSEQIYSTYRNGFKTELAGTNSDPEGDTLKWMFSKSNEQSLGLNNNLLEINIYPNPTNSIINWSNSLSLDQVIVSNLIGKILLRVNKPTQNSIDLTSFSNGIYMVKMIKGDRLTVKKIIKK
ncbi:T9SS type A sorting domain-containing protein [Polaribacter sp. BAL334]|uniref:T9SS type A sorting domain-containing protein n=1 Tax=Polaribacter sp. BAL334 TaxID=1708178 RepID=UPI0018D2060C|nr:T9SS type A sorting domain-containing protein [Polaribacter sp. BAL334]MBG7613119.1 T9SS type A sorting domain-containing protein [Polaribacter sp. BAL334]